MKKIIIAFCLMLSITANSQSMITGYMFGLKRNAVTKQIGIDIAVINDNHLIESVQSSFPYGKLKQSYINLGFGYSFDLPFKSAIVPSAIVGIYSENNFDTLNGIFNVGIGCQAIFHNLVSVGMSFTNKEKLSLRIGFIIPINTGSCPQD